MMSFFKTFLHNQKIMLIGMLVGTIAGYFYWQEVGCLSGHCAIQSVWYNMTLYGAVMGGLLGAIVKDYIRGK